jgi:hypothetical protein
LQLQTNATIRRPKTVKEAYVIDKENRNDYWRKAIHKEMENMMVAFDILESDNQVLIGYQFVHSIWFSM